MLIPFSTASRAEQPLSRYGTHSSTANAPNDQVLRAAQTLPWPIELSLCMARAATEGDDMFCKALNLLERFNNAVKGGRINAEELHSESVTCTIEFLYDFDWR